MSRRREPPREIPEDFVGALEWSIRDVLKDPKTTPNQRIQAITAGVKLEMMKHKIKDDGGEGGNFFNQPG